MNYVEFPGLGIGLSIHREAFSIFGISIYWYGIIIALALLTAVFLGIRDSQKFGLNADIVLDLVLFAAPVAIACARLYYVAFDTENQYTLADIFNTRKGGLAIYGGILGAITVGLIFAKVKRIGVGKLFDFAAPYLPLGQAIGRWGNFFNQEAFGIPTHAPWRMTSESVRNFINSNYDALVGQGMKLPPENLADPKLAVHPTFLYESLWNIIVFFVLLWFRKRKKVGGEVFFLYMALYGVGRAWIEPMRTDSLWLGNLRVSQLLALGFAIICSLLIVIRRTRMSNKLDENVPVGASEYGNILVQMKEDEIGDKTDGDAVAKTDSVESEIKKED